MKSAERPHWLTFVDVLSKALLAGIGIWWAVTSFGRQQDQTDRNVRLQLEVQRENAAQQRLADEAKLIVSVLERFQCKGKIAGSR